MFYDWLSNPIKQVLFAGDANAGCGPAARRAASPDTDPQDLAPMCNDVNKVQGQGTWMILGCFLRQNRVKVIHPHPHPWHFTASPSLRRLVLTLVSLSGINQAGPGGRVSNGKFGDLTRIPDLPGGEIHYAFGSDGTFD